MANAKPKRRRTTKRGPGKLTAKQDEVKKLLDSGQTIVEVAELMDTTPGAIKAQISRMKKIGVKIATSGGRSVTAPASAQQAARANRSPAVVDEAAEMSVEDHLGIELARVDDRLTTVGEMLRTLGKEQDELTDRKGRLEAARAELAPGGRPALAVVA